MGGTDAIREDGTWAAVPCDRVSDAMTTNEGDRDASRVTKRAEMLAGMKAEWIAQQKIAEAHLVAVRRKLAEQNSPETRALVQVMEAQCGAIKTTFDAKVAAAEDLLLVEDAAEGFSRVVGDVALNNLARRLATAIRTLLEAEERAATTLLEAEATVAAALRAEQEVEAERLWAVERMSQG